MQTPAALTSFQEQGKEDVYIELLKEIYTSSSMTVHLHKEINNDILTCANTPHEPQQMLEELADGSENQVLKMNKSKSKVVMDTDKPTYVNNTQFGNIESYI